ncbi:MAG TPA: formate dehydrogenase accessory sulfurtransferase FdhD [Saprospiraceae bacterium]|nr:formate dehydrogenase accessory sulfurtransferase FdhD [Saprospiraceae bacterium]
MPIGHHSGVRQKTIFKIQETFETANDLVVVEEPLEIVLQFQRHGKGQHKTLSITMRTPGDDEHLVRGFLFTEGILKHPTQDIERFEFRFSCTGESVEHQTLVVHLKPDILPEIENLDRHFYTSSSCGVCGKTAIDLALDNCSFILRKGHPVLPKAVLFGLPKLLNEQQELFQKTGGIHACAIFNKEGELLLSAEDVGRHNALDKLVGKALEAGMVPLQDHVVLLSGRASFELVQKAFMMGTPILAAVGAPSSLAVETAELSGMTLAGFLKNDKCNIYTAPERIQA